MTWAEFVAKVEALGVKASDEVWYIDTQCLEELSGKNDTLGGDGSLLGWAITDKF